VLDTWGKTLLDMTRRIESAKKFGNVDFPAKLASALEEIAREETNGDVDAAIEKILSEGVGHLKTGPAST
jgi:hypothetical protein